MNYACKQYISYINLKPVVSQQNRDICTPTTTPTTPSVSLLYDELGISYYLLLERTFL